MKRRKSSRRRKPAEMVEEEWRATLAPDLNVEDLQVPVEKSANAKIKGKGRKGVSICRPSVISTIAGLKAHNPARETARPHCAFAAPSFLGEEHTRQFTTAYCNQLLRAADDPEKLARLDDEELADLDRYRRRPDAANEFDPDVMECDQTGRIEYRAAFQFEAEAYEPIGEDEREALLRGARAQFGVYVPARRGQTKVELVRARGGCHTFDEPPVRDLLREEDRDLGDLRRALTAATP